MAITVKIQHGIGDNVFFLNNNIVTQGVVKHVKVVIEDSINEVITVSLIGIKTNNDLGIKVMLAAKLAFSSKALLLKSL